MTCTSNKSFWCYPWTNYRVLALTFSVKSLGRTCETHVCIITIHNSHISFLDCCGGGGVTFRRVLVKFFFRFEVNVYNFNATSFIKCRAKIFSLLNGATAFLKKLSAKQARRFHTGFELLVKALIIYSGCFTLFWRLLVHPYLNNSKPKKWANNWKSLATRLGKLEQAIKIAIQLRTLQLFGVNMW